MINHYCESVCTLYVIRCQQAVLYHHAVVICLYLIPIDLKNCFTDCAYVILADFSNVSLGFAVSVYNLNFTDAFTYHIDLSDLHADF